ncbi:periplasmic protein TonB [Pararobbsia alpina]|uniref:TonB family protein n=1 Tax=Pararobbsia alpina TaxID=621374 RepID=UPI0039A6BF73
MATELFPMTMHETLSETRRERNRIYPAVALALVIEALLIAGACRVLQDRVHSHVARPPTVVTLSLAAPPKPAPAPDVPKPAAPPPVKHEAVAHPVVHTPPKRQVPPPVPVPPVVAAPQTPAVTPSAVAQPVAPAAPPAPAQPATPPKAAQSAGPDKSFEGALRAAIQAALHYPESARMAGMSGRTRVAFRYQDGVASDISVVVSSGVGLLDRAAVAAVHDAAFPKPAAEWAGKALSEQIWVTFDLDDRAE